MSPIKAHRSPASTEGGDVIAFPGSESAVEYENEQRPGTQVDLAPAQGEIVEESPVPHAPGAVVEAEELGPVLPAWAASPEVLKAHMAARTRKAGHVAAWHACRSPKYAGRVTWRTTRGACIATAHVIGYMAANDYNDIIRVEKQAGQRQAAIDHAKERKDERARRMKAVGIAAGAGAGVLGITTVAFGPLVLWVVVSTALVGAYMLGRPHQEQPMLDVPEMPVRVDLAPDHLNDAFRAAGLLKGEETALMLCAPILREGNGWLATVDMPRGGGKSAKDVLARRDVIAAELGVDEIQLIMERVRAHAGGHAGRLSIWVADDDPYLGAPTTSPLETMEQFSVWQPLPYGRDARGRRIELELVWQSMFFGGLPRRGKTFSQRLVTAAGLLDPYVKHFVADFKGGGDWKPMQHVAHRLVLGAEDDAVEAFKAMLAELLSEMERRFKILRDLPPAICPEGKLTPEIQRKYNLPFIFVTIDELQELFDAIDDKAERAQVIKWLARIARRGPAAGFISNYASQRPDAETVPAKLRDIVTIRYCTQVTDRTSSDMVLGKGKANMGADASTLSEEHKGVGVLVTGPANHTTVKVDLLDGPAFAATAARGRELRITHNQLTGEATADVQAAAGQAGTMIHPLINDVLDVMRHSDRMFTEDLLAGLVNLDDDGYGDWDATRLSKELELAGVQRSTKQVKIAGTNRAGYRRSDVEAAVPVDIFAAPEPDNSDEALLDEDAPALGEDDTE